MSNIFRANISKPEEQYYCAIGYEDFLDDSGNPRLNDGDNDTVAAKVVLNKKPRQVTANGIYKSYFIKVNPSLQIFNPSLNTNAVKNKTDNHFINKVCKNEWFFKEVDSIIFNKYITFLKSPNAKLIKEIERDLK